MKYIVDHDLHIHSTLSLCGNDPEQSPARILQYALDNGYRQICLTDHFWDERVPKNNTAWFAGWYDQQDYAHVCQNLPLPQSESVEFLFGVETDMTLDLVVGISPERCDAFDFINIPISHFHQTDFTISKEDAATPEGVIAKFFEKMEAVLDRPLPYHKVGLAHLVSSKLCSQDMYVQVVKALTCPRMAESFKKAAALGVGIELNTHALHFRNEEEEEAVVGFYRLAKECGCKFYFGTDAHTPGGFEGQKAVAERMVDLLGLTEEDKFRVRPGRKESIA